MSSAEVIATLRAEWEVLKADTQGCTELSCPYHGETVQRMRDLGRAIAHALDVQQSESEAT